MEPQIEKILLASPVPSESIKAKLRDLLPGAVVDGVLDVQRLSDLLEVEIAGTVERPDRFGLSWAGKATAVKALQTPSQAALAPDHENSVDWDRAENLFIEGDNLEVLKLLQKAYNDKVKLIYIDPPYNTGNDFVYNDDYTDSIKHYLEVTGQVDAEGNRLVANSEISGRKHSNWLNMMFSRLSLARNLLTEDGVLMISIDETEVHNAITLLNEVFGEENQIGIMHWKKRSTGGQVASNALVSQVEFVILYSRNKQKVRINKLPNPKKGTEKWRDFRKSGGQWQRQFRPNQHYPIFVSDLDQTVSLELTATHSIEVLPEDSSGTAGFWENNAETAANRIRNNELVGKRSGNKWKIYQLDIAGEGIAVGTHVDIPSSKGGDDLKKMLGQNYFDNPKPTDLIQLLIQIGMDSDSLIVDFFAGSGTTGHSIALQNAADGGKRRYVLVNIPEQTSEKSAAREAGIETVSEITRMRLHKVLETVPGAKEQGLRCLSLTKSSFLDTTPTGTGGELSLFKETLDPYADDDAIVAEALLKSGVMLDKPWMRTEVATTKVVVCDGVAVSLARRATQELVTGLLELDTHTVIFLEDSFENADDVKANASFAFKRANKTMKSI